MFNASVTHYAQNHAGIISESLLATMFIIRTVITCFRILITVEIFCNSSLSSATESVLLYTWLNIAWFIQPSLMLVSSMDKRLNTTALMYPWNVTVRLTSLPFNESAISVTASSTAEVKVDERGDTALRSNGLMISSAIYGISTIVQKQNIFCVST